MGSPFRLRIPSLCVWREFTVGDAIANKISDFGGELAVADADVDERVDVAVLDGGEMTEKHVYLSVEQTSLFEGATLNDRLALAAVALAHTSLE